MKTTTFGELRRALASLGCAVVIGGLAALFYASGEQPFKAVSVLPALIALFLLYNTIHSLLAARNPASTLTLERDTMQPGETTSVLIRQAGPIRLHSLRANLVCERSEREFPDRTRAVTYPCQLNFFDSGPCDVRYAASREFHTKVTIPQDAEPSLMSAGLCIEWRIELWGKVAGGADFMRPFALEITSRTS